MSLYFFVHNLYFALDLLGAVAFLMAAWLTFDTYTLKKDATTLLRAIGFGLCASFYLMSAVLAGDIASYAGFGVYLFGLLLVAASFIQKQKLHVQAIIVLPAFAGISGYLSAAAVLLLLGTAYLSYRVSKEEFNPTWRPFTFAFGLLGVGALVGIWGGEATSIAGIAQALLGLAGFLLLAWWVWQFLALRIRESLILIFISSALFLSTVVTLAFSTILISQITTATEENLLTDAKVLNLHIESLAEGALAKTALIAVDPLLAEVIVANDFPRLEQLTEGYMEAHRLGFVTVTDAAGNVLVRAHALSRRGDSLAGERAWEESLNGNRFVTIEESPVEKLSIRAAAPIIKDRLTIGTVVAGYPLDNALVDNIKRVTGLEMFIYTNDISTAATALAADGRTRITGAELGNSAVLDAVLAEGQTVTSRVVLHGQTFLASYLPLSNADGKIIGMLSAAKPQSDILALENATNRLTLITVIVIMLVLAWPIFIFTRRLTKEE